MLFFFNETENKLSNNCQSMYSNYGNLSDVWVKALIVWQATLNIFGGIRHFSSHYNIPRWLEKYPIIIMKKKYTFAYRCAYSDNKKWKTSLIISKLSYKYEIHEFMVRLPMLWNAITVNPLFYLTWRPSRVRNPHF